MRARHHQGAVCLTPPRSHPNCALAKLRCTICAMPFLFRSSQINKIAKNNNKKKKKSVENELF